MVVVSITGRSAFEVALEQMALGRGIAPPDLPLPLEWAMKDPDLGVTVALAAAIASAWPGSPGDYLRTEIPRELGWRYVDLSSVLRKSLPPDRFDKVITGACDLDELGFEANEIEYFFREAGIRSWVYASLASLDPTILLEG